MNSIVKISGHPMILGFAMLPLFSFAHGNQQKPNILLIITDQQQAGMMSCAGNPHVSTPNLDKLAKQGVRFERAYAANPVCVPSRFSLMTGLLPSVIGMEDNDGHKTRVPGEILDSSIASLFTNAGYETAYAGKKHLTGMNEGNGYENPLAYGFSKYLTPDDPEGREPTVESCIDFLSESGEKPFLLVASLINPHDICYLPLIEWTMAEGRENPYSSAKAMKLINDLLEIPEGMTKDAFIETNCPPLPGNFKIPEGELPSFTRTKQDNYIGWSRRHYTENDWRLYRYLYARLMEVVDQQIGQLLDALAKNGLDSTTLVVFTSDHGDQDASHQTGLKGYLYEESANIPLIFRWPGVIPAGRVNRDGLASNGLDLLPTLCGFAGITTGDLHKGENLRSLVVGKRIATRRSSLVVENNGARLLLFDKTWKYMTDSIPAVSPDNGSNQEMLFNLGNDPGEQNNLAIYPERYNKQLVRARKLLREWYGKNNVTAGGKSLNLLNKKYFRL
jgi:arylsulfatase A-like enzyme